MFACTLYTSDYLQFLSLTPYRFWLFHTGPWHPLIGNQHGMSSFVSIAACPCCPGGFRKPGPPRWITKPAGPARAGLRILEQVLLQSLLIILGHFTGREDILQSKKGYVGEKNSLNIKVSSSKASISSSLLSQNHEPLSTDSAVHQDNASAEKECSEAPDADEEAPCQCHRKVATE